MVVSWLNDAAVLIPILIGAAAVCRYVIFSRRYKLSTVKSNLKWFRRHTALTVSGLALYFAFWAVTWLLDYRGNPYCFVSYNYPEASQGLNPNGTKFAVSEMTSEELLGKTIEEEGITEVTTGQLKECLKVEPVRTDTEVSLEQPYINTEYVVQLSQKNGKINAEPNQMLSGYIDQLEEMIMEKYSRKTDRLKLNFDGLKEGGLSGRGQNIRLGSSRNTGFYGRVQRRKQQFHSQATGESFGSLEKKVSNFRSISLENFNAFVLENGLSKNREQYIGKLNYDNLLLDVEYLKNRAAYRIYLEAIDMYERDMASIVLIPTRDTAGEFYMSRTKIGVDNFSNLANQAIDVSKEMLSKIENNSYTAAQLRDSVQTDTAVAKAEEMLLSLQQQLTALSDTALAAVEEFDSGSYLTVTYPDRIDMLKSCMLKGIILAAVMFGAVAFWRAGEPEESMRGRDERETV